MATSVKNGDAGDAGIVDAMPLQGTEPGRLMGFTQAHNIARARFGVPEMSWDEEAAAVAQAWADQCQWRHNEGRGPYGENLAANAGVQSTPSSVVESWMSEEVCYDYATNSCDKSKGCSACGHFTQVIWTSSVRVGCGVAACTQNSPFSGNSSWEYWVCNYAPAGNVIGQRPY